MNHALDSWKSPTPMGLKEDILQILPGVFLEDLDPKTPTAKQGKRIETSVTQLIDGFRVHPNARLATLGRMLWAVIHHRHVHMAMSEVTPTMAFMSAEREGGKQQGLVLIPPSWGDLLTRDPSMAVGGIVFTGSQAIDYYNGRIGLNRDPFTLIKRRCLNYEAEFLRTVPASMLNKYQREVLEMFPTFDESCVYEYRPVAPQLS